MTGYDEELEQLRASVSCATVLEKFIPGWTLDSKESTRRSLKYRRGAGEIVIVNHEGRGWWDPQSRARGDVFTLVQHLDSRLNFGQVRRALRPLAGIAPAFPQFQKTSQDNPPARTPAERWAARRRLHRGSPAWRYLTITRCLPATVIAAAHRADVLREGPYGSAWFAHRDHQGSLTGIEMRGPNYRGFTSDSHKSLFRLPGSRGAITRLAVFEAPINAMSLAAIERVRTDTIYVSTTGGMGPGTIEALRNLMNDLAAHPCASVAIATDNDLAGERYAAQLSAMSKEAHLPWERLLPTGGLNDWNDVLRTQAGRGGDR